MADALQTSLDHRLHKIGPASSQQQSSAPSATPSSSRPKGRASRGPKRYVPQPTNLEVADDTLGPLGPLGAAPSEDAIEEPQQEHASPATARQTAPSQSALAGSMASVHLDNDEDEEGGPPRARVPPPVQPPLDNAPPAFRQTQPSVSVVEAAKPSFSIQVGDPHKVGDLTSAHTEYNVYTKVNFGRLREERNTNCDKSRQPPKHTATPNSPSLVDSAIFSGYITSYIPTTLESLSHLLRRSKPSVVSIQTLSSREGRL
jgi:hypothetical protein